MFEVSKANIVEQRRVLWTTHYNLSLWFETWKQTLIDLGFARDRHSEDGDSIEGELFFFPGQTRRIINLDETDGSLDNTTGQRGGRPSTVFLAPDVSGRATSVNKSGYSSTIICGSNAAGEAIPPHFQLKTLAKKDDSQKMSIEWFQHCVNIHGQFGHNVRRLLPCTFGMNERAGMNHVELDKYIKKSILPLYPDVEDVPLKRVLLKLDSGPGRTNVEMLADLRLQGVYVVPGVPNTTAVTQETDQNYGIFKMHYRDNLQNLTQARHQLRKHLVVTDIPLLVFGGRCSSTMVSLTNSFSKAFSLERNRDCWKKCGAVPLTRLPLQSKKVRHELNPCSSTEENTIEQQKLLALEAANHFHSDFLNSRGFDGYALRKNAPQRTARPPLTVPLSRERIKAIRAAKNAGQLFHATGGQHLNSDEFFHAKALATREADFKKMEDQKKKRIDACNMEQNATAILEKKGFLVVANANDSFTLSELKILFKWKGLTSTTLNAANKIEFIKKYEAAKIPPKAKPWSPEEEECLHELKNETIPPSKTALGVATKQMARAVSNNIAKLDDVSRQQLLQSLAKFETEQRRQSSEDN